MVFQCLLDGCKKTFLKPAKLTCIKNPSEIVEYSVCPHCRDKNYQEIPPVELFEEFIVSVKSVDLADVDNWLQQGYIVKELYAKTATLIKKAVKQPSTEELPETLEPTCDTCIHQNQATREKCRDCNGKNNHTPDSQIIKSKTNLYSEPQTGYDLTSKEPFNPQVVTL